MNLFRLKVTTPLARDSISRSTLRRGLILLALVFAMGTRTATPQTCAGAPAATTNAVSNDITSSSAALNGTVNPNGCSTTAHFCWGTNPNCPNRTGDQSFSGSTTQNLTATISGLTAATTYHFNITATNSSGTTKGSDMTFTTLSATAPVVATNPATFPTTLHGTVNPQGISTTVWFQYGTTTSYGSTTPHQTKNGSVSQDVSATVTTLAAATTYHFQTVATNSSGTAYSPDATFTTH